MFEACHSESPWSGFQVLRDFSERNSVSEVAILVALRWLRT
jgi:hypothetical protein